MNFMIGKEEYKFNGFCALILNCINFSFLLLHLMLKINYIYIYIYIIQNFYYSKCYDIFKINIG